MKSNDNDDELKRRVASAYDEVLHEPVPQRLTKLLAVAAPVVDLAAERAKRAAAKQPVARGAWGWAQWGGMAASLALGVIVGWQFAPRGDESMLAESGGQLVAGRTLAQALDARLASEPQARIAVQLSFLDKGGRYCRTFSADALAGLACRDDAQWNVVTTAQVPPAPNGAMRPAASSLPKPVLDAVDARIAGVALDAAQERAARDRGWRR